MFVLIVGFVLVGISSASLTDVLVSDGRSKRLFAMRKIGRGIVGLAGLALMVFSATVGFIK